VPESLYLRYLLDQLPTVRSWCCSEAGWPAGSYREICDIFENPYSGPNQRRTDTSPGIECRIQALLLALIAKVLETLDEGRVQAFNPEYYQLKVALDFMQSHFRENPTLEEIAARVRISPNYFHRRFRRLFGTTPFDFMLAQRLNQARRLLVATDSNVKEVAAAVGYEDAPYFTRVFTRQMQISPSEYRRASRQLH